MPSGSTSFATGAIGQAAFFTPGAKATTSAAVFDFGESDFTISLWVRFNALGSDNGLIGKSTSNGGNGDGWLLLRQGTANKFWFCQSRPGLTGRCSPGTATTSTTSIQSSTWYHVAVTRAATEMQLWVNGVAERTSSYTGPIGSSTAPLTLGGTTAGSFEGSLDDVRIFDRALTGAQIAAIAGKQCL